MNKYESFLQLHLNDTPLLIGNVWDVTSAKVFEQQGFKAIATSSSAIARSMGYEDGENIPFDLLLKVVERIAGNISIPLSVDLERGYGASISQILQNIEKLHDLGAVGFNIEDSMGKDLLRPADEFEKVVSSIANHLASKNMRMYMNARTDAYLVKMSSPLTETLTRIKAYENAGATGIFVPFITDKEEIKAVTAATKLPVNVLCHPKLPMFNELSDLGVRRVSMGGAAQLAVLKSLAKIIETIKSDQSFKTFYA